ncbi:MAG: hypothetical protein HYX92_05050 [Chloroflexi bacterium]|nr:hypothetical protein [Chloroflexota bacterium]
MAKKYLPADLSKVRTVPLASRANKVEVADFARVGQKGMPFSQFLETLPRQLAGVEFGALVDDIVAAHRKGKPVIWGMGAHVIKCGLSPLVIELMRRGVVTAVAMNGAGAVHDVEIALIGATSEDVAAGLGEGTFGAADETGKLINETLVAGATENGPGMGELLGKRLVEQAAPHCEHSILAMGVESKTPVTVHVALGTDIVHMHPLARGAQLGAASFADFRLLVSIVADLGGGGAYLNVGSAVLLPEVFLKALAVARNLGHDVSRFVTANLDMLQHYRPLQNVVKRPTVDGGKGYILTGHHEIMVPLLVQAIIERLG